MVVSLKLKECEDTGQFSLLLVLFPSLHFPGKPSDLVSIFHNPHVVVAHTEAEVTEQDSLLLTRNLLATAMFNRGHDFERDMKLMSMDAESPQLIEKGVHNGLLKNYYIFCTCETLDSSRDSTFKRVVPTLGELMSTLAKMPDQPQDYEPPFFLGCLENEAQYPLLRTEVGNVNSKRLVSSLKGKSVLDPCENENDHMQDDVKRTRPMTRCKFLAQGYCPFGTECWFSHHVGGDGIFCHEAGCSREVSSREFVSGRCCWDTSVSKVFRKPESRLAGVNPSQENIRQSSNTSILETVRTLVCAYPDHALPPSDLKDIFGTKLFDICCGREVPPPPTISCWFHKQNQFLSWRSAKRAPNWSEGVTRVDRKWVELSEEDKKKIGPIRSKQEHRVVGDVRDQEKHELCWAYADVNLVSSLRVIEGLDKTFVTLSVRELCFYASTPHRSRKVSTQHKCHPLELTAGLRYIRDHGVSVQRGGDSFNCVRNPPKERNGDIKIADLVYGNDLPRFLKRLETQPIGATLVIFSEYWETRKGQVYRGPTRDKSEYLGLHGVNIVDAFLLKGELVFWCKSSNGTNLLDKGYILVSAETMVMAHHFNSRGESTFGVNDGKAGDTALALSKPKGLIHDFVYPVLKSATSATEKKRKR